MTNVLTNASNNPQDNDITLLELEAGSYLERNKYNLLSVHDMRTKIEEFSSWFNSVFRLSFNCDKEDQEEFLYLLLTLKKNIKSGLTELNKYNQKKEFQFVCSVCDEVIAVDNKENIWSCLQNHEHFEQIYLEYISGKLPNLVEPTSDNSDSGIDQFEVEMENLTISSPHTRQLEPFNGNDSSKQESPPLNDFKFNFVLHYDEYIESKIYPESLTHAVTMIDKMKEYSIQRSGRNRGTCLLCACELVNMKISKHSITSHVMGQRHLRFASNPANISALKNYHQTFLNLEVNYQAHQVFFRPEISSIAKCMLCKVFVNYDKLKQHIEDGLHRKRVINLYESKNGNYYLIELQVLIYGINPSEEIKKGNPAISDGKEVRGFAKEVNNLKEVKKTTDIKHKNGKKADTDSSPSSSERKDAKHNIIKSVENKQSTHVLELLPNRFKEHLKFLKKKGNTISCEVCKVALAPEINVISIHIQLSRHLQLTKIEQKKYTYYCEICNFKFDSEIGWEAHFTTGPNKHANVAESRKSLITEYECTKCKTVIFGDELSLSRHLSVGVHQERRKKDYKLSEAVKKLFKSKPHIEDEGVKLSNEAAEVLNDKNLTDECCRKIEYALLEVYSYCKAHPFGSRVSGLGNYYSDLDIFIDTGDMYNGYKKQDNHNQVVLVRDSAKVFYKYRENFQHVQPIPLARTPIVRLYHADTELDCDLSFRHGLSVENTKFLQFCLKLQPIAQPFVLLLKKWSELCKLNEHVTTYALAMMAIFYLQVNNYLLSVKRVRELNPKESLVIDGWETIIYSVPVNEMKAYTNKCEADLYTLLKGFFHYYSTFKYEINVICPLVGLTIPKALFTDNGEGLPKEMISYVRRLRGEDPELFRSLSPICIQDPFDLSHNLTKACSNIVAAKLKALCDLSFKHLEGIK